MIFEKTFCAILIIFAVDCKCETPDQSSATRDQGSATGGESSPSSSETKPTQGGTIHDLFSAEESGNQFNKTLL